MGVGTERSIVGFGRVTLMLRVSSSCLYIIYINAATSPPPTHTHTSLLTGALRLQYKLIKKKLRNPPPPVFCSAYSEVNDCPFPPPVCLPVRVGLPLCLPMG